MVFLIVSLCVYQCGKPLRSFKKVGQRWCYIADIQRFLTYLCLKHILERSLLNSNTPIHNI